MVADDGGLTVSERLHDCPPKLTANNAEPAVVGVPETENDKLPAPVAKVPACKVAIKPVTPVEAIDVPAA